MRGRKLDVDHVADERAGQVVGAVQREDIVRSADDPFAEQKPANQLLVVARCAHQHGGRPARKSDLKRRFDGDDVHAPAVGAAAFQGLDRVGGRFLNSVDIIIAAFDEKAISAETVAAGDGLA